MILAVIVAGFIMAFIVVMLCCFGCCITTAALFIRCSIVGVLIVAIAAIQVNRKGLGHAFEPACFAGGTFARCLCS